MTWSGTQLTHTIANSDVIVVRSGPKLVGLHRRWVYSCERSPGSRLNHGIVILVGVSCG